MQQNYASKENTQRVQCMFRDLTGEVMEVTFDGNHYYAKGSERAVLRLFAQYVKAGVGLDKVGFDESCMGYYFWLKP